MREYDYTYAIIWGAVILLALFSRKRSRMQYAKGAKILLAWLLILAVIFSFIVYWPEFKNSRFYNFLVAGSAATNKNGTMQFTRASDGHFHINALVNGMKVEFLVDTGAADITLNQRDAKAVGIYPDELNYIKLYYTANGPVRGASVKLKNIEFGNYQTGEIYASVNQGELNTSLLGMSFLNRMKSYRIEGDILIINP